MIHPVNFGQFKLISTDIEKNPGPSVYVDATKTIHAPYCQGNVVVFGENAGQQCVAMSLCALIYSKIRTPCMLLVTCTVMPELRGITTVCHLKHSWL